MVTKTSDTKKTTKKSAAEKIAEPAKTAVKASATPKRAATAKTAAPKTGKKTIEKEVVSSPDTKVSKRSTKKADAQAVSATVKPVKIVKAKASSVAAETSGQEKSSPVVATRNKHDTLKDNALKTHMKKFTALKEETAEEPVACADKCCCFKSFGCSLKAWGRAYANIFNFKGRTSRYEFWAFMLINYFLLLVAGNVIFNSSLLALSGVGVGLVIVSLLEFVIYLALYTRRLHDTGVSAWKGFFRPLCIAVILWLAVSVGGELWIEGKNDTAWEVTAASLAYIVFAVSTLYYLLKIFLFSAFFEEQKGENAFGKALYFEDCYKKRSLCFAVWYTIIFGVTFTLLSFRLALLTLLSQGLLY